MGKRHFLDSRSFWVQARLGDAKRGTYIRRAARPFRNKTGLVCGSSDWNLSTNMLARRQME